VENAARARKSESTQRTERLASPGEIKRKLDAPREPITSLVDLRARKVDVNRNQRCPVRRRGILLDLVNLVRYGVRRIPRVVRDDNRISIDLSRDRDPQGTECRRSPKDEKTEEVSSYQFHVVTGRDLQ
jgi:hypothetical protein